MTGEEIVSKLKAYQNGRHSAADDDQLEQLMAEIPTGIELAVFAVSTDTAGDPLLVKMRVKKEKENGWRVAEH